MRTTRARSVALLLALISFATPALADWPAGGKSMGLLIPSYNYTNWVRFQETSSGDLVLIMVGQGGNDNGVTLQRVSKGGDIAAGWPASGFQLGEWPAVNAPFIQRGFAVDDSECVWHAGGFQFGLNKKLGQQLARPDAVVLPSAGTAWPMATPDPSDGPTAVQPAPGGAFLASAGRLQRVTRAGTVAPGWPASGVAVPGIPSFDVAMSTDGAGGVVLMFLGGDQMTLQRFGGDGVRPPGWPAAGLPLSSLQSVQQGNDLPVGALVPSGPGEFLAFWGDNYHLRGTNQPSQILVQRFSVTDGVVAGWPPKGTEVVAQDTLTSVTVVPDGSGGAHVLWYRGSKLIPYGTHVLANGQFATGLGPAGVPLIPPGAQYRSPISLGGILPFVLADAGPGGGLIFAWNDNALAPTTSYRVRWLGPDYSPAPGEPVDGRLILPAGNATSLRGLHADGAGGAFVAWEVRRPPALPGTDLGEIWMTRLLPSSLVNAPPVHAPAKLALSAPRPNPARDAVALDVTLPDDSPARVELLDVAGRVVRTQLVQGAGPHAISIRDLATLSTGLYFARVTHPRGSATSRVVVTR